MERECRTVEYKSDLTKSYLKTVSAYANYGTGIIKFGVADDGTPSGMPDPVKTILSLENQINDNILPNPYFQFSITPENVVILEVQKGRNTPYCYHGKAYKRNDSATIEVDPIEFRNLVLNGQNLTFTEIPWINPHPDQQPTFHTFEKFFSDRFGMDPEYPETMITLEIYSKESGWTNCAAMLSDQCPFCGIDIVITDSDQRIRKRVRLEKMSVLEMITKASEHFESEYFCEIINGLQRKTAELIPFRAFREALVNAIVHREWQINSFIRVEMTPSSITILSPGGLPEGITKDLYLSSEHRHLSILRNKTLGLTFLKLGLIENLGSGIPLIHELYRTSATKPTFDVTDSSVAVTLPVLKETPDLQDDELHLYQMIRMYQPISSTELLKVTGFSRTKQLALLNTLMNANYIEKIGNGRKTKYRLSGQ